MDQSQSASRSGDLFGARAGHTAKEFAHLIPSSVLVELPGHLGLRHGDIANEELLELLQHHVSLGRVRDFDLRCVEQRDSLSGEEGGHGKRVGAFSDHIKRALDLMANQVLLSSHRAKQLLDRVAHSYRALPASGTTNEDGRARRLLHRARTGLATRF